MNDTKATSEQAAITAALRNLVAAIDSGLPMPSSMSYHTYEDSAPIIGLTFGTDGKDKVAAWTSVYGKKYSSQPRLNTTTAGSQWLTTSSFDLPGVYVQISGTDPRPCSWLGGCDQPSADNDEQLCTAHAPVDGEVVETVPALPAADRRGEEEQTHVAVDAWTCSCGWKVDGFTAPEFAAEKLRQKHIIPANAEVTA